jgi:hypothetical protein
MKTLAGDHVDDQMLQTLWLHRLPLNVQLLVSASDGVPLEKMANIADKLVEIVSNRGSPSIAAIANQPAAPPQTTVAESLKSLQEQVAALSVAVKQLTNADRGRSQKTAHTEGEGQRARSQSRKRWTTHKDGVCFYHQKYAENARKCLKPCKFEAQGN